MEQDFISEIMDFNPSDLSVFNEKPAQQFDSKIYKTNPANSVSEDGHYRSSVRILYNPFNIKYGSIVQSVKYAMNDIDGFFMADSRLALGDRNCPIFKAWKQLWFSGDEDKKMWAKQMFEKSESRWVLVQVIEDANRPDLVGQFLAWKLPKAVSEKMDAKMHPSADSKKTPVSLMDFIISPVLEIDVTPGPDDPSQPSSTQREISYSLCDFATDATPIIKTDGTQLFEDAELETIETFVSAKAALAKGKTPAQKEKATAQIEELKPTMRELYSKALAYMKENAIDIEKEVGFQEWSEPLTKRVNNWLKTVLNMQNPKTTFSVVTPVEQTTVQVETPSVEQPKSEVDEMIDEDLPF